MHLTNRCLILVSALTSLGVAPGLGQIETVRRNQFSVDVGPLEAGSPMPGALATGHSASAAESSEVGLLGGAQARVMVSWGN